ncbi:MAG: type II secretion system GspH family protein [Elusimicrobiota bacterium]
MKKRKGFTLVEVVVSILISALVAMASFSIFTSSAVSERKSDKREIAGLAIKMAQETLKNYVTSDTSLTTPLAPSGGWRLRDHQGNLDSYAGWALQSGVVHNITNFLNREPFLTKLCNGNIANCSFTYTVSNINQGFGDGETQVGKQVVFTLTYPVQPR